MYFIDFYVFMGIYLNFVKLTWSSFINNKWYKGKLMYACEQVLVKPKFMAQFIVFFPYESNSSLFLNSES